MSTVYIIGNGFDLNLGLQTSYRDFVKSEFFTCKLGNEIKLFDYLHRANENSKWIDIEKELVTFSKQSGGYNNFLREYKELCQALKAYIASIDINSINIKSDAYKLLSSTSPYDSITVINFNYTNSVIHILESLGYTKGKANEQVMHIHGSINIDEIIFGVEDKARISDNHTFLYKSTSPIYNGRRCIQALKNFETLHIFGHSLGESDHLYLEFFQHLSMYTPDHEKEINIYCYGEESIYSTHKQLQKLTSNSVSGLKNNTNFKVIDVKRENLNNS